MDAELAAAMRRDQAAARGRGEYGRIGRSGRLHCEVDLAAVMAAVDSEGPEVMGAAGRGWWADQKRRCPWIDTAPDKGRRVALGVGKVRTRFGVASFRKVYPAERTENGRTEGDSPRRGTVRDG